MEIELEYFQKNEWKSCVSESTDMCSGRNGFFDSLLFYFIFQCGGMSFLSEFYVLCDTSGRPRCVPEHATDFVQET